MYKAALIVVLVFLMILDLNLVYFLMRNLSRFEESLRGTKWEQKD